MEKGGYEGNWGQRTVLTSVAPGSPSRSQPSRSLADGKPGQSATQHHSSDSDPKPTEACGRITGRKKERNPGAAARSDGERHHFDQLARQHLPRLIIAMLLPCVSNEWR